MTEDIELAALLKILGDLDSDSLAAREQAIRDCIPRVEREIGAAFRADDSDEADRLRVTADQLEDAAGVLSRLYFAVVGD